MYILTCMTFEVCRHLCDDVYDVITYNKLVYIWGYCMYDLTCVTFEVGRHLCDDTYDMSVYNEYVYIHEYAICVLSYVWHVTFQVCRHRCDDFSWCMIWIYIIGIYVCMSLLYVYSHMCDMWNFKHACKGAMIPPGVWYEYI